MPGATATIEVEPVFPIARKDCMIPQTVPKSPMKGQAEAVVARKVMYLVRRETSAVIARSSARSTPEMFLMRSLPAAAGGDGRVLRAGWP